MLYDVLLHMICQGFDIGEEPAIRSSPRRRCWVPRFLLNRQQQGDGATVLSTNFVGISSFHTGKHFVEFAQQVLRRNDFQNRRPKVPSLNPVSPFQGLWPSPVSGRSFLDHFEATPVRRCKFARPALSVQPRAHQHDAHRARHIRSVGCCQPRAV